MNLLLYLNTHPKDIFNFINFSLILLILHIDKIIKKNKTQIIQRLNTKNIFIILK